MHELSIAEGIIDAVDKTAARAGISRVVSVRVAIGELAGVDEDALRFAWTSVTRDGTAKGASLVIERPEGRAWCLACGCEVPLHRRGDPCPKCGGWQLAVTGGGDLRVVDLEVPADEN